MLILITITLELYTRKSRDPYRWSLFPWSVLKTVKIELRGCITNVLYVDYVHLFYKM